MPNHCMQRIRFEDAETLTKFLKTIAPSVFKDARPATSAFDEEAISFFESAGFSFEWIIPSPKTLSEGQMFYPDYVNEKGFKNIQKKEDKEWFDWYSWNSQFWGTKWDAYEVYYTDNEIWFETAWAPAVPIYEAIAKNFPEFDFVAEYAEEQGAVYCGRFEKGCLNEYDEGSDEAYELYNELWGEAFIKDENGKWVFDEG